MHMVITEIMCEFEEKSRFEKVLHFKTKQKMPRERLVNKVRCKRKAYFCRFCRKMLTKEECDFHFFMCEKVPQEVFNERIFGNKD